jgi:hypothetical protein
MRKFTLLLSMLALFTFAKAGIVEKTYYFSSPQIKQHKGYQKIFFGNDLLTSGAGDPAMPYTAVSLLLPPGEEAVSVELIGEDKVLLKGEYNLWPYQPSRPLSETKKAKFYKNRDVYRQKSIFPEKPYGRLSTQYLNGYAFAFTAFTPLQYVPGDGQVSYFSKVTIRIKTRPSDVSAGALKNLSTRKEVVKKVISLAQNKKMLKLYPEKVLRSGEAYELLIITPQQYENSFTDLQNIYTSRGIRSKVITTEYIGQNMTGQDLQEKIRNFIIQEYQQSDIEYVLLGGDVEYVPYRGFYTYVQSGSGYEDYDIPADLYYSALDGNWNTDGDNKWGEADEDDLLPDVAVARFSFSNSTELANMIHKSIFYQNDPVTGEFRKPLLVGEWLYNSPVTYGKDYLELLIGEHDDNGYTTIGIPENYDIQKMYEADGNWSGTDLRNKINAGLEFVHHVGHANQTYVAKWSIGEITDANFSGANGVDHNYTIMQTHGCLCGSFDFDDCILEKMVSIQNFAVAVIGNSRYGWFNEGQTEGPAAHLHREMVDALFHEKMEHIGQAFVECKIQTAPWVEAPGQWEEGALRWNFYDINILGDPAMSVWTDEPVAVTVDYPENVMTGISSFNVSVTANGGPAENFRCAVMKDGTLIGSGVTGADGIAKVDFFNPVETTGEASLIVTGYNCLPDTNDLMFVPTEGAYMVYAGSEVDDAAGNANGQMDNGEEISLDIEFGNVGSEVASDVQSFLTTDNEWIELTDSLENLGDVQPGDTVLFDNAFAFKVANNVPDQTPVKFSLSMNSGSENWTADFTYYANAPVLKSYNLTFADDLGGDPDPGDDVIIRFDVRNYGHNTAKDCYILFDQDSPYLILDFDSLDIGDFQPGEQKTVIFPGHLSEIVPLPSTLSFQLNMVTGDYVFSDPYSVMVGVVMEGFETGDFSEFEWLIEGDEPWVVTNEGPYDGDYCAKSGDIGHEQFSELKITLQCFDYSEISFARKVSSEEDYDFFKFYIDDQQIAAWSGEKTWQEFSYAIGAGAHVLRWSYTKDFMVDNGQDCAWLDNIVFPATTMVIGMEENITDNMIKVYPNPCKGTFYVDLKDMSENVHIRVFDIQGKLVFSEIISPVSSERKINLQDPAKGIYFVKIKSGRQQVVKKIIVQ